MYKTGEKFDAISVALQIPLNTLKGWAYGGRWKDRQTLVKHKANSLKEDIKAQVLEVADTAEQERIENMTLSERQTCFEEQMSIQAMRLPKIMSRMSDLVLVATADKVSKLAGEARKALKLEKEKPSMIINVGLLAQPVPAPALPAPPEEKQADVIEIEAGEPVEKKLLAG
jgi:hypothetical protein